MKKYVVCASERTTVKCRGYPIEEEQQEIDIAEEYEKTEKELPHHMQQLFFFNPLKQYCLFKSNFSRNLYLKRHIEKLIKGYNRGL